MAVLTRALSATALATRFASASSRSPSTSMVTRCVAPSASAAMARARSAHTAVAAASKRASPSPWSGAPLAVGEQQQRVVGAGVALDADAVERGVGGAAGQRVQVGRGDGGVGQDEGQHRRHVRADHRRPLGEAGQPHLAAADRDGCVATLMRVSVVRMAWAARSRAAAPASSCLAGAGDAVLDVRHRQVPADDAGGADEHLLGPAADGLGGEGGHAAGVVEAALPGAGVGVARADDDAARLGAGQALAADVHRGGADAVLREDAGGRRGAIADDQGQVEALRLGGAQAAVNAGVTVAAGQVPVVVMRGVPICKIRNRDRSRK